jgi:hypothetical protein
MKSKCIWCGCKIARGKLYCYWCARGSLSREDSGA